MLKAAVISTLLPLVAPAAGPAAAQQADDPAIKVWLNKTRHIERGDRIRAYVRGGDDGYLVVLHADPEGRVRVLFPLDPDDDNYLRGARDYELRGRGDRHAFTIYESSGQGTVFAAYSRDPFRFDEYVLGDHWDYGLEAWYVDDDAEVALTALVRDMVAAGGFEYDLARYDVGYDVAYAYSTYRPTLYDPHYHGHYWRGHSAFSIHIGFGSFFGFRPYYGRWYRAAYYDPYYYDPFFHDPFFYDPFYYGYAPYSAGFFYGPTYRAYPRTVVVTRPRSFGSRRYTFKSTSDRFGIRQRPVQPRRRSVASSGRSSRRVTPTRVRPNPPSIRNRGRRSSPTARPDPAGATRGARPAAPTRRGRSATPTRTARPTARPDTRRRVEPQAPTRSARPRRGGSATRGRDDVRTARPAARPSSGRTARPTTRVRSTRRATTTRSTKRSPARSAAPSRSRRAGSSSRPATRSSRPSRPSSRSVRPPRRSASPPRRSASPPRARRSSPPRARSAPSRSPARRSPPRRSSGRRRN